MNPPPTQPFQSTRRLSLPIPADLRFFALLTLLLLVLFSALRFTLIASTHNDDLATPRELLRSYLVGLRFDLATASYVTLPVMLLCLLPFTHPSRGPRTRRAFLWGLTALISSLSLVALCEIEFFREFQTRFNELALRYLLHPQTVGGMIWYDYPVLRYLSVWLVASVGVHFALRLILRIAYSPASLLRPARPVVEILALVLVFVAIIFGARGGFQGEPLRWGAAFRGPNEFANQMSLNGLFSLANAGRDMIARGRSAAAWKNKLHPEEAKSLARSLFLAEGERLVDPEHRALLRTGDPGSSLHLRRADGKPVNVVVVMMESFTGRRVGALGAERSFTPHFDELATQGILFDRTLSAGSHTHQGIFATQLGFPNLPGYETLMDSSAGNQNFLSLSRIFEDKGYQTLFLYNGDLAWDNMYGFFQKQGVNHFVGGDKMLADAKYPDPVWGVSDTDLFERANKEFEAASKKGPFMAAVMTLSNHSPYIVPPVPDAAPITGLKGKDNKRMEALRYADHAIGQFIAEAKKLSYFKDTLFVFIGDHGTNILPMYTEVHLLFHHVPLLFYAPGLLDDKRQPLKPRVDSRTAGQTDVLPSVLALLGMHSSPRAAWGRSLFNDAFHDGGFTVFKQSGGGRAVAMAQGDHLLVLGSSVGKPLLMTFDLGPKPTIQRVTDLPRQTRMERELRAVIQSALHDLDHRTAGPIPNPQ